MCDLVGDVKTNIETCPRCGRETDMPFHTCNAPISTIKLVQEFHRTFVTQPDEVIQKCRLALLKEELAELEQAIANNDRLEILDALTDLQYVLDGTYIVFGMAHMKDAAFAEVHRSNMSKLGEDGNPIYREDGKVLKGPRYSPPNLERFFEL